MFDLTATATHRRGFLARVAAATAGLAFALPPALRPDPRGDRTPSQPDPSDEWLSGMKGKHRQLFDMPAPNAGIPQLHIRNFMESYRTAYKVPDKEINAVGTLYGMSTLLAFQDAMWEKYKFGEALKVEDPATKAPLARNMFAHPREGDPFAFGFFDSSIEALQKRGVLFLLCNNALGLWSERLAKAGLGSGAEAVREDLLAHALPGVFLVPAMVVAINKAQERGFSYMYLA